MTCEMCGKSGQMFKAKVEGAEMTVCEKCKKYGQVLVTQAPRINIKRRSTRAQEPQDRVISNYASIIQKARQKSGIEIEKFAKQLNEKESTLKHVETGSMSPSIQLARKLENALHIKLIELTDTTKFEIPKASASEGMTLGDFIKVRKKKQ